MRISYDKPVDVLYIALDEHENAEHITCVEGHGDTLIQVDCKTKQVVGFTILHFSGGGGPWAYDLPLALDPVIAKELEALDESYTDAMEFCTTCIHCPCVGSHECKLARTSSDTGSIISRFVAPLGRCDLWKEDYHMMAYFTKKYKHLLEP